MNIQDCYRILQVPPGAGLDEVKSAFRRQAFQLHPDLNPSPKAAEQFRRLNEAYVLLTHAQKDGGAKAEGPRPGRPDARAEGDDAQSRARKAKAEKAYAKQRASAGGPGPSAPGAGSARSGSFYFKEEEVLRDLLSDPFARQVFEDIYSQLKTGKSGGRSPGAQPFGAAPAHGGDAEKRRRLNIQWGEKSVDLDMSKGLLSGIGGGIKGWLRGQLDFEQTVHYPAHALGPGRSLRLTVSPRFGEPRTVEITLPPDFVPGRPIRLKGLGRKLGPFTGDLILRVLAR